MDIPDQELDLLTAKGKRLRWTILDMIVKAKGSHIGPSLSMVEILLVLYDKILCHDPADPFNPNRDRFILSKGHGCAALYVVLAECGFFSKKELETFIQAGSRLGGHPERGKAPGVEMSAGSLAHGLSVAAGVALAAKLNGQSYRTFCLVGDGECEEGAIWEAALFSAHRHLDNLSVIVDFNKLQCSGRVQDVLNLEPLAEKWRAFGWDVSAVDGHDIRQLYEAFQSQGPSGKPRAFIAHTIKGKGISYMEGQRRFHSMLPNEAELKIAREELGVVD